MVDLSGETLWVYGPVRCLRYPLLKLDSLLTKQVRVERAVLDEEEEDHAALRPENVLLGRRRGGRDVHAAKRTSCTGAEADKQIKTKLTQHVGHEDETKQIKTKLTQHGHEDETKNAMDVPSKYMVAPGETNSADKKTVQFISPTDSHSDVDETKKNFGKRPGDPFQRSDSDLSLEEVVDKSDEKTTQHISAKQQPDNQTASNDSPPSTSSSSDPVRKDHITTSKEDTSSSSAAPIFGSWTGNTKRSRTWRRAVPAIVPLSAISIQSLKGVLKSNKSSTSRSAASRNKAASFVSNSKNRVHDLRTASESGMGSVFDLGLGAAEKNSSSSRTSILRWSKSSLNRMGSVLATGRLESSTDGPSERPVQSVLELIVEGSCHALFTPFVRQLITDKWAAYAREIYQVHMLSYLTNLILIVLATENVVSIDVPALGVVFIFFLEWGKFRYWFVQKVYVRVLAHYSSQMHQMALDSTAMAASTFVRQKGLGAACGLFCRLSLRAFRDMMVYPFITMFGHCFVAGGGTGTTTSDEPKNAHQKIGCKQDSCASTVSSSTSGTTGHARSRSSSSASTSLALLFRSAKIVRRSARRLVKNAFSRTRWIVNTFARMTKFVLDSFTVEGIFFFLYAALVSYVYVRILLIRAGLFLEELWGEKWTESDKNDGTYSNLSDYDVRWRHDYQGRVDQMNWNTWSPRVVLGMASVCGWLHFLHNLRAIEGLGPFVVMVKLMIKRDISRFLVIYFCVSFGFTHLIRVLFQDTIRRDRFALFEGGDSLVGAAGGTAAATRLLQTGGSEGGAAGAPASSPSTATTHEQLAEASPTYLNFGQLWQTIQFSFRASLVALEDHAFDDSRYRGFSVLVYNAYVVLTAVILFNLLIAMMADTYARVRATAEDEFLLQRTSWILEAERSTLANCKLVDITKRPAHHVRTPDLNLDEIQVGVTKKGRKPIETWAMQVEMT
ncbi:unnamed protein product [Amoebophrya sp. A25]|nr:unnamed protein product [Amoebophrya sp. A25]|eukprot:GSA25T00003485001.1